MQMAMIENIFYYFLCVGKEDTCLLKIEKDPVFWLENSQIIIRDNGMLLFK